MTKTIQNIESCISLIEKDIEQYPQTLQPKHIADYLGVSAGTAMKVMKAGWLPVLSVPGGKLVLTPKRLFVKVYAKKLLRGDVRITSGDCMPLIQKDLEDYPYTMQARHISEYFGVGMGTSYKLLKSEGMPSVGVPDSKLIIIPKQLFIAWYVDSLCGNGNTLDGEVKNVV